MSNTRIFTALLFVVSLVLAAALDAHATTGAERWTPALALRSTPCKATIKWNGKRRCVKLHADTDHLRPWKKRTPPQKKAPLRAVSKRRSL